MTTESLRVEAADLTRPPTRATVWLRGHPVTVDAVVALVACAPHMFALLYGAGATAWWGYLLLAAIAGALVVRRRRPVTTMIVVAAACALSGLTQLGFDVPTLSFAVTVYTAASLRSPGRVLLGYATAVAVTMLATIPESLQGIQPDLVSLTDPVSLLAGATGLVVRSRRDHARWLTATVNQRIENASLTERTRIAAEMHDLVAHSLTVMVALANGATSAARKHPEQSLAAVEQIAAVGRNALDDMHHTLALLRGADSDLDANLHHSGDNLPPLEELVESFGAAGLPISLTQTGPSLPTDAAFRQAVYRIVQESLTNTLRHAHAPTAATVTVDHGDDQVVLTITDDGGPAPRPATPGYGLIGIRQRAAAHAGHAESGPQPGGGWRTRVVLGTGANPMGAATGPRSRESNTERSDTTDG